MKVLFVCTGNTCRSSMAEALARKIRDGRPAPGAGLEFSSAGVAAWPGDRPSWQAVEVMAELGVDLTGHAASRLRREDVEEADLILTMTAYQRDAVLSFVPSAEKKVFTLAEYAGAGGEVPDPIGQPVEVYRRCARRLEELIARVLDRLCGVN